MDEQKVNKPEDWDEFVKKLIRDTKFRKLKWADRSLTEERNSSQIPRWAVEILPGKYVVVADFRTITIDETNDEIEVEGYIALDLCDHNEKPIWRIPASSYLKEELLDAIQYVESDAAEVFQQYLQQE